jgi:hypothetical protein
MSSPRKTETQLAELNRKELLNLAGEVRLKGSRRMRKDELKNALLNVPGIAVAVERLRQGESSPAVSAADARRHRPSVRAAAGGEVSATAVATVRGTPTGSNPKTGSTARGARRVSRSSSAPGVPVTESRVLLMPIGPCAAHVYWQSETRVLQLARRWLGDLEAVQVLRFYDRQLRGSGDPGETFDIEIDGEEGSYYLDTWSPGRALVVELGMRSRAGAFAGITKSNEAELPRDAESEVYDARALGLHRPVSSLWKPRRSPPTFAELDTGVVDADSVGAGYAERVERVEGAEGAASGVASAPSGSELGGRAGTRSRDDSLAVPVEAPLTVPVDWEGAIGTSSGELVGSDFSSQALLDRDGRLRVSIQAELVVRGRTRPGTELTIEGIAVPVNPDGTFQLSFSVPAPASAAGVNSPSSRTAADVDDPSKLPPEETS